MLMAQDRTDPRHESMSRTLSDEDLQAIATSVVDLVIGRLTAPPQPDVDRKANAPGNASQTPPKLAYTIKELCAELSLSPDTIYKLECGGRLRAMPGIRRKIYSRIEVERLLRGDRADWQRR